jgi:pyridoxamine 5'-phosphate oxidase
MAENAFSDLRIDYGDEALRRADLPADPLELFQSWMDLAIAAGVREPNAMSVATCGGDGQPHCRVVLLKQFDASGFGFFTNKQSSKADQVRANGRAAATFWWVAPRARQVRVEGVIREMSEADSDAYFASRPRAAQICSAASPQSRVVKDRSELEGIVDAFADQVEGEPVPRPPHWGGYVVVPGVIEFWQGRDARLHDRFRFVLGESGWQADRLAP